MELPQFALAPVADEEGEQCEGAQGCPDEGDEDQGMQKSLGEHGELRFGIYNGLLPLPLAKGLGFTMRARMVKTIETPAPTSEAVNQPRMK